MPRFAKVIYFLAGALAVVAFLLGVYEYVVLGSDSTSVGSDVVLPLGVLGVIVALYVRRKRAAEGRRR